MARSFVAASSQYLEHAAGVLSAFPITVCAWANPTTLPEGATLFSLGNSANDTPLWSLRILGSSINLLARNTGQVSFNGGAVSSGQWSHFAAKSTAADAHAVYINAAKTTNSTSITSFPSVNLSGIGRLSRQSPTGYFNGGLAEVSVWAADLGDDEITILSQGYSPRLVRPESLAAYWSLIGRYAPEIDPVGGFGMTVTGATAAAHPRVIYPRRTRVISVPAAGGSNNELAADDATHAHTADGLTVTQDHSAKSADASHSHAADAVAVTQDHVIAVADARHGHSADALAVSQNHVAAVADALHAHAADGLATTHSILMSIAAAAHAHAADGLAVTTQVVARPADSRHTHKAEAAAVTQDHVVDIADALHAHTINLRATFSTINFVGGRWRRPTATGGQMVRASVAGGSLSRPSATGGTFE